jgi:hypothetical protein
METNRAMTTIVNKYVGITHPISGMGMSDKEHDIILAAWKKTNCIQNHHLWDEVWSLENHYLHCDACGIEVHISKIVVPDGKDKEV